MPTSIADDAQPGSFLLSPTMVTATGSGESVRYLYVLLGEMVDLDPPGAPLDLAATPGEGEVSLSWTANTEGDLGGYPLYRDADPGASTLIATVDEAATSYVDEGLDPGTYYYRLTAVDDNGNESGFSNEVEATVVTVDAEGEPGLPTVFTLHSSYPNPFRGSVTVPFDVPHAEDVVVTVYSALGERVAVLARGPHPAARHRVTWDAGDVAAGVYFVRLQANSFSATRKLVLLR
jgi:hypothetical protein